MSSGRTVLVTGIGSVLPGAVGRVGLIDALRRGASQLKPCVGRREFMGAQVGIADPGKRVPIGKRRRMNRVGQMAVSAALDALADAGLAEDDLVPHRTGIAIGTGLGCSASVGELYREILSIDPAEANPAIFPIGVPNSIASQVALVLALGGPNVTVSQGEVSGEAAIALGADWIRSGRADRVLVGGVDELTEHFVDYMASLDVTAPSEGKVRPLDELSQGAGIGEGAVFLLLEADPGERPVQARIEAWAIGGAPVGVSVLDAEGMALSAAVTECLLGAGEPVSFVIAGANGHPAMDRAHLAGLSRSMGAYDAAISSIKGLFGESLSTGVAAGAAAAILCEDGRVLVAGTGHGGAAAALVIGR